MNIGISCQIFHGWTALLGLGLVIVDVLWSHSVRHTTVRTNPLDEWSAHCRDLYLTALHNRKGRTSVSPVEFEPAIIASERPQTQALDRAATGIDSCLISLTYSIEQNPSWEANWFCSL